MILCTRNTWDVAMKSTYEQKKIIQRVDNREMYIMLSLHLIQTDSKKKSDYTELKFIELLKQKILLKNLLLSRKYQDTSHKSHIVFWLVSIMLLCLARFCA